MRTFQYALSFFLFFLVLTLVVLFYTHSIADGDLFWHLKYGQYMLNHGTLIPDHSIFSWTPVDNSFMYCSWIPELFFYLVHSAAGFNGLYIFRYVVIAAILFVLFHYAWSQDVLWHPLTGMIILLGILILSVTATLIKPKMFSTLFMTLTVLNWWTIRRKGDKAWWYVYFFPLIFLLWVNSHGSFLFGLPFLAAVFAGDLVNWKFNREEALSSSVRKHFYIALGLVFVSLFITPYGPAYFMQLLMTVLSPGKVDLALKTVGDYKATLGIHLAVLYSIVTGVVILYLGIVMPMKKRLDFTIIFSLALYIVIYFLFIRTTQFIMPVFCFSAFWMLKHDRFYWSIKRKGVTILFFLIVLVVGVELGRWAGYNIVVRQPYGTWLGSGVGYVNGQDETLYVKKHFLNYQIGNDYNGGGYLLWKIHPEGKVMIDPRYFPYMEWYDEYILDFIGGKDIKGFMNKFPFDVMIVFYDRQILIEYFLENPDWKLAFYGSSGAVFIKKEIPLPGNRVVRSSNVTSIKNLSNAVVACSFALTIKDWRGAEEMYAAMKKRFFFMEQQMIIRTLGLHMIGINKYFMRDYHSALKNLQASSQFYYLERNYLLPVLYHVAVDEWTKGSDQKARELINRAWEIEKDELYGSYNFGVTGFWQFEQRRVLDQAGVAQPVPASAISSPFKALPMTVSDDMKAKSVADMKGTRWYSALEFFLEKTKGFPAAAAPRKIVTDILKGRYHKKPPLIHPPEPPKL